jgi:hypothetical protein
MIVRRSHLVPRRRLGTSTNVMVGMLNASQKRTNHARLSEALMSSVLARCAGLFPTIPTDRPSTVQIPQSCSLPSAREPRGTRHCHLFITILISSDNAARCSNNSINAYSLMSTLFPLSLNLLPPRSSKGRINYHSIIKSVIGCPIKNSRIQFCDFLNSFMKFIIFSIKKE